MIHKVQLLNNEIEILIEGKGAPLIILPGMGCSFYEWINCIEDLKKSFQVISIHRCFYGLSRFPLVVLGRNRHATIQKSVEEGCPFEEIQKVENVWSELIIEQSQLSHYSELYFIKDAGHMIHLDAKEKVVEAIFRVATMSDKGAKDI